MADRTIKVLEPADSFDFLTLEEAKVLLGMSPTDTTHDEQLTMMISIFSTTIATYCNRTFAREKVIETWREEYNGRLFLSHWPVKEEDIEQVAGGTDGEILLNTAYELEEASGKLSFIANGNPWGSQSSPWIWPTAVTYTGGYNLPEEAPLPLKQATTILIMDARVRLTQAQTAGIRQITHKESRIMFFDPNALLVKTATHPVGISPAVDALLKHYIRIEV